MFELINVSKNYQNSIALKEINFSIKPGEIVGIVGKSGSGKTTLLRLLNLMEPPTSGAIKIAGVNVARFSKKQIRQHQQQMGMIFQNFNLLANLTVYENVALPLKLSKMNNVEQVNELLNFVDIAKKSKAYPAQLSGGEQQRVSIARALSRNPNVLLCDEATSSLDEENTENVIRLLWEIHQKIQPTIIFVSHELEVVKQLCNRIFVMEHGKIIGAFENVPNYQITENLSYLEKVERSLAR